MVPSALLDMCVSLNATGLEERQMREKRQRGTDKRKNGGEETQREMKRRDRGREVGGITAGKRQGGT
jgi:hypothetical protein